MSVEHVGDGASDDALLLELLLKAGYTLTSPTKTSWILPECLDTRLRMEHFSFVLLEV